jgi:hypothetical protein
MSGELKILLEASNTYADQLISLLGNIRDEQDVKDSMSRLSSDDMLELKSIIKNINAEANRGSTELYHGTTHSIASDIKKNGFKISKGVRSGFMGHTWEVDNQGIFLSDDKSVADAYGRNRDAYDGRDSEVLTVYGSLGKTLDMTEWSAKIPKDVKTLCLRLLSDRAERTIKAPKIVDMFWLMDQPELIKYISVKYDTIIFREDPQTLKELGINRNSKAKTYMVLDPKRLKVRSQIVTIKDLANYIN